MLGLPQPFCEPARGDALTRPAGRCGDDIRARPLVERKERLQRIIADTDDDRLRYSEEFSDPVKS